MREKLEKIRAIIDEILSSMDSGYSVSASVSEWDEIKSLLESEAWPQAVFPVQIADEDSEEDKKERAQGICDIILPSLEGKRFLDFGCGEGHVAKCASKEAKTSVGYDIKKSEKSPFLWGDHDDCFLLTNNFEVARAQGPYDLILLYDVLDHALEDSPTGILNKARELLADGGSICLRCHPWCGRHGGHVYKKLNKAFAHLVLTKDEMGSLGIDVEEVLKFTKPLDAYKTAIVAAGLVLDSEPEIDIQEVEDFFRDTPVVRNRILNTWGVNKWEYDPPAFQMSQCFVDYVLKKKNP